MNRVRVNLKPVLEMRPQRGRDIELKVDVNFGVEWIK
jgi:hypothetical protein